MMNEEGREKFVGTLALTPALSPGEREKRAPPKVPEGRNVNSRGRQPTVAQPNYIRPLRGRTINISPTVSFTHGYSCAAASRPLMR
jgi:hypothetical protein